MVSVRQSYALKHTVVRYDVATVGKFMVANGALSCLLHDFSVQQFSHFGWGTEFPISPRVVRIFNALNTKPKSAFFSRLLATAAEERSMDRTVFIPTEFHGDAPV
jgi:hypothetical protein